ncbi:MAG TPA: TonB-dependent receptor [Steroidobacter sp.]
MVLRLMAWAAVLSLAAARVAHAQGIATEQLIDSITVIASRHEGRTDIPNPTASMTAQELRTQNLVNPEDALRYAPNLTLRKRYIGDRNALVGGRSFSTLQAPRALVLMDGYLLSNFLGRFDAPRWNMIAPEEIDRVDVLYGPYSALYPGNSIGTTVAVRTRRPQKTELSVRTSAFGQRYEEYGLEETFSGYQLSVFFGSRFSNDAWLTLAANRQDSTSHPMQYFTVSANAAGEFPAPTPSSTDPIDVSGVRFDTDPRGRRRAVFGASAGAIDHTVQNQWKVRGGCPIADWIEVEGFLAQWTNDTRNENRTLMRDAAGNPVWHGRVRAKGIEFDVPLTALAPSTRFERHEQWGVTLRTTRDSGWNGSIVHSRYEIREDSLLEAGAPDPLAASGGPGTNTGRDGTRWQTFEVQGVYSPEPGDWTGGAHTLALGYHRNDYRLRSPVYETSDWRRRAGELMQDARGETQLEALYLQDTWSLSDAWALTLGVRYEEWQALQGLQWVRGLPPEVYADRRESAWSPKASLSFSASPAWTFRLSAGRGVRFPTVAELFLGTVTPTEITRNDPNLKPEISDAVDFTVERFLRAGHARLSLFQDDIEDTIWNQVNILVFPRSNVVQNIDRVRTRGIEAAFSLAAPAGVEALSIEGSVAYSRSRILRNEKHPAYVGNEWPRIPDWRATLNLVWQPDEHWIVSLGARYNGRMYNRLENDDFNSQTYGAVSPLAMLDARVAYKMSNGVELALGIDNLTNERAWQMHPYPGRTALVEARWQMGEER